jgi:glycosyltransferase involved in cell wall biosynthesis
VVTTIHDATPIVMPMFGSAVTLKMRFQMWNAAKFSRAIITDSEWSRQDVIRLYGLPPAKVSVVYLGYDKEHFNTRPVDPQRRAELLKRHGIERPFALHHGVIQPRKNLQRLVKAYRLLLSRRPDLDLDLVLAGPNGWLFKEIMEEIRTGAVPREKIVLTGALSDTDLGTLIKSARLVAIPSLYEGFCLPMVEAMACGVPTIASSTSCLPEISGGTLRYFDPLSVEDMAAQMETALVDDGVRADLSRKGLERAASFDWRRCAEQTLELLVRVGQNGKADRN